MSVDLTSANMPWPVTLLLALVGSGAFWKVLTLFAREIKDCIEQRAQADEREREAQRAALDAAQERWAKQLEAQAQQAQAQMESWRTVMQEHTTASVKNYQQNEQIIGMLSELVVLHKPLKGLQEGVPKHDG